MRTAERRYRHPDTGNMVLFESLPAEERARLVQQTQKTTPKAKPAAPAAAPKPAQPTTPTGPKEKKTPAKQPKAPKKPGVFQRLLEKVLGPKKPKGKPKKEKKKQWKPSGEKGQQESAKKERGFKSPEAEKKHTEESEAASKLDEALSELKELGTGPKPPGPPPGKRAAALELVKQASEILGKSAKDDGPDGHQWKGPFPKGWTTESRKKFWDMLTGRAPKHKVTQCIKKMKGKVGDPGAFCAALADREIPGWREEAAKERRKKAALATVQAAGELLAQPLRTRRDYGEEPPEPTKDRPRSQLPTGESTDEEPKRR